MKISLDLTDNKLTDIDIIDYAIIKLIYASTCKGKKCFISYETLAKYFNLSARTILRHIKNLKKCKYIYLKPLKKGKNAREKCLTEKSLAIIDKELTKSKKLKKYFTAVSHKENKVPDWYENYDKEFDAKLNEQHKEMTQDEKQEILNHVSEIFS